MTIQNVISESLLMKMKVIHAVFADADIMPFPEFLSNLMSDCCPERELNVWEWMAANYEKIVGAETKIDKKKIFSTLLCLSMNYVPPEKMADPEVRRVVEMVGYISTPIYSGL